jgi:hypothetical protein
MISGAFPITAKASSFKEFSSSVSDSVSSEIPKAPFRTLKVPPQKTSTHTCLNQGIISFLKNLTLFQFLTKIKELEELEVF